MFLAPARVTLNPSRTLPGTVVQYQQPSGFESLLATGGIKVILDEFDKAAYVHKMDIRTKVAVGQNASNQLPSVDIAMEYGQAATYLMQVQAAWNRRDIGAAAGWNVDLINAQRFGMRQGIFQQFRNACLYGNNPAIGEGLLNAIGATTISAIPADPFGFTTVTTIDNGWMQQQLLNIIQALKVRTMMSGMEARITICGPQRVLTTWEYQVVQLTQYQRAGAGSQTIKRAVDDVGQFNGDTIDWVYDDTLIGKGPNGYDAVLFALPEVKKNEVSAIDTNEFANNVGPHFTDTIIQLADRTAPTEYLAPIALDGTSMGMEMLGTSGWVIRPECLTILGAQYP
jgi:hypothetical protein